MIWNRLINIKYDEHQFELYLYVLFICTQGYYEIYEEKKNILHLKFFEFKILIYEKCINIPYWTFSSLLIVDHFKVPLVLSWGVTL